ncbi:polyhydroxyalkanoate synthesis repressor PhaR [Chelatococcus daeguensis]|uniref:Polyhydroxyalkanoate synthesis repressor PhaR n=2 Tax=Chelatococcus TaxID=28209 RepID=A0AAC9JP26_9HYPH|nr:MULTISPECIES: polyhydroxyalkanoate synthesis repressor PhaR [Chelatococcus]APF36310.1 polyhydroxyalkanoate synthesis repressor PhaR [Chelatococcus daeguensis]KZE30633.1 polyhydroxyalkanoate synthesis repressor [Chelatococcus daeguensis]MBM3081995.1 polyhydroxyalkanoate synthesis repressor PhaR [Chelatococcus daeguensis]CUA89041.1 polyhydroxyalkanoate synthesis repressor PhaR [Chelatococcus sambhunathii]
MATEENPTVIKKYANRRLYHTGTSTYVTLEDLAQMVRDGEDFIVFDAKTNEDITRSVLTQIIFEEENKAGQNLLPVAFLRQLIRFYGDSMQALVPSYLEFSIENFTREQQKLREKMAEAFGPAAAFKSMEEHVRTNMAMFGEALRLFSPFGPRGGQQGEPTARPREDEPRQAGGDLDDLKRQVLEMQARLDELAGKGSGRG